MTQDIAAIARATYTAYITKDRKALEALIADDFCFSSPLDNRLDRTTYFTTCSPNSDRITGFEIVHLATQGEHVFVTYIGSNRDGHRFRNTEVLTIRDGRVREVEVYFGWSLPHPAAAGTHVGPANARTEHA
jgi:ketosteroid isomerase-like protein